MYIYIQDDWYRYLTRFYIPYTSEHGPSSHGEVCKMQPLVLNWKAQAPHS